MKRICLLLLSIILMGAFGACNDEGPAERAGENLDEAAEETGETLQEGVE